MTREEQPYRLQAYRRLSRLLFPRSYVGKIVLLAVVSAHVPLIAVVAYLLLLSDLATAHVLTVFAVTLIATLVGTSFVLTGLWVLLAPVASVRHALHAYRDHGVRPALPTDIDDEGGRLLADVQHTLIHLDEAMTQLEDRAVRDSLTGVYNRRGGEQRLADDLMVVPHRSGHLSLILLDADGLKLVNDRWGHAAGDACLQHLAAMIARHVGGDGWVARWGGDEFLVGLWAGEGARTAERVLAGIVDDVAAIPIELPSGEQTWLSVSGGVAHLGGQEDAQRLLERTDAALDKAKRSSRPT